MEDIKHENTRGANDLSLSVKVRFVYTCETTLSRMDYEHAIVGPITNDKIARYEEDNDDMSLMEQLVESEVGVLFVKVEDA
jgi:hypothetical protein